MIATLRNGLRARLNRWLTDEPRFEDYVRLGMRVGKGCRIQPGVVFDYSHCWLIQIGNEVTIAPQAYLLAHDASSKRLIDYTRIGSVIIEDGAFIGARALILPGVTIGRNSVIAAGSVVTRSVPAERVYGGNPARELCTLEEYRARCERDMRELPLFERPYTLAGGITEERKQEMVALLGPGKGWVR